MKRIHTLVAVIGITAAGALAYWWQNLRPQQAGAPLPQTSANAPNAASGARAGTTGAPAGGPAGVEVGRVERMALTDDIQAVGSLRSRQGVMLRPEVSGRVSQLGFQDGQRVRRGQVLVQLDDALQRAQLQQAQAQAGIAGTNLQRNRELLAQNFVSQSALDQTAASLQVAKAQVALAQAQLARMRITAPFDGIAGIRSVNVGDYVRDGADLVGIEDVSTMLVDFRLPESAISRLKVGLPVEVSLDAMPGRSFNGQVDAIDSTLDANGRSLLVRARLPNVDGSLRPGLFARARLVLATRADATVVPEEALVPQGGKQLLIKLVPSADGKGQVSQRIEARIGLRLPGKVEILDGLQPGDTVVTAGHGRLLRADGVPVKVVDIERPAARPGRAASAPATPASPRASGTAAV
jgi:membrane fusion protein (multidrug efflux system)